MTLKAANLKQIAEANLSSADKSLASDSRLVLIGFALENLKQGKKAATESLMELIKAIPKSTASNDVPTLMVLGQARDTLAAYGDQARAGQIRERSLICIRIQAIQNFAPLLVISRITFSTIISRRYSLQRKQETTSTWISGISLPRPFSNKPLT